MDPAFSIPAFYSGKSIFITGATGFLGKSLTEKLLRSCPDIKELFLLIRSKKGASSYERLQQMISNPLFDILRQEQPHCFDKIIPVDGDIGFEGLGLSDVDRDMLIERTSVIFHIAAVVRFDNTMKDAVLKNLRSTRDICIFAERMKHLVAFVYISSLFTQVDKYVIDEFAYPMEGDWKKTIEMAETLDEDVLEIFKSKYIGTLPNHYIFTKRLAEKVIIDYSKSLPCVICRPSIVTPALRDPVRGWVDNINGPIALYIGYGKGVMKAFLADDNTHLNYIPSDIVIKSFIVAGWKRGARMTSTPDNLPHVYNCALHTSVSQPNNIWRKNTSDILKDVPFENMISFPGYISVTNIFIYNLLALVLHVIPALFIDALLQLSGSQPRLLEIYKKIARANLVLSYFTLYDWNIRNNKMLSLSEEVPAEDQHDFGYAADMLFDLPTYLKRCIIGCKLYILNESMDRLDVARTHYNRMFWIDKIVKVLFTIFLVWIIYKVTM